MSWLVVLVLVVAVPVLLEARRIPWNAAARASAPGQLVGLGQGVTHYRWHGSRRGPVAVCVHGLTTPSFVWDAVIEQLAAMGFRVLSYDLYGRGYSDRPRGRQDRGFFIRQLEDLLVAEGLGREITLFGYSMGGSVATVFAAQHPQRIQRLVLIAPSGLSYAEGRLEKLARRLPGIGDWLATVAAPLVFRRALKAAAAAPSAVPNIYVRMADESRIQGFARTVLASQRGLLSEDLAGDHAAIAKAGIPVLAIWGAEDAVIPLKGRDRLATVNPDARQVTLEGAGHGIPYERPEAVTAALREFLGGGRRG